MPHSVTQSSLRVDSPDHRRRWLACRSLIACGYDFLTELLSQAVELISEHDLRGERNDSAEFHSNALAEILGRAQLLIDCKTKLHSALEGEKFDGMMLDELKRLVAEFENDVRKPLAEAAWASLDESARQQLCMLLGVRAQAILGGLNAHRAKVMERLHGTVGEIAAMDARPPTISAATAKWSVVSIDLHDYTASASAAEELIGDPQAVYRINTSLLNIFDIALRKCGLDPIEIPRDPTGDGALIFIPEKGGVNSAERAIWFALTVLDDTELQNARIKLSEWQHWLRIGVATGRAHMVRTVGANERVLGFEAAGSVIITAVRLQAACDLHSILICDETRSGLSEEHRLFFPAGARRTFPAKRRQLDGYPYQRPKPPGDGA